MTEANEEELESLDKQVEYLLYTRERLQRAQLAEYEATQAIIQAMERRGASYARTDAGIVRVTRQATYDYGILAGLREITSPDDLKGIYTPSREEVRRIPERWDMAKGRKLLKLGNDHAGIIEDAKIYGSPKVKIDQKGEARL